MLLCSNAILAMQAADALHGLVPLAMVWPIRVKVIYEAC